MGKTSVAVVVLDAGALIALERGSGKMRALLRAMLAAGTELVVPAGVVGQVWRDGARQAVVAALLHEPITTVVPLDGMLAKAAGTLCGRARTSDVIDASVVLTARRAKASIVTSDPDDLGRLDPTLTLHVI